MLNNIRSKQTILVIAIVLLVGFLFTRDVKGLVKPKEQTGKSAPAQQDVMSPTAISIEEVSTTAKNLVSTATTKAITALEVAYQKADDKEKLVIAKQLSQKWDDVEQNIPSALYAEIVALGEPSLKNWLTTGERAIKAFENTQDTLIQPAMLQKANFAFKSALSIDSTNTDAKTGLGITIVSGMGAPMQGIALLMEVVAKEPKNLKAQMKLGIFAMQSGQFDKAIIRFNNIVDNIKKTPDAYFHLATAYESLGKNKEAIEAFLNSKKLAANPTLSDFIDKKVAELQQKN